MNKDYGGGYNYRLNPVLYDCLQSNGSNNKGLIYMEK